MLSHTRQLLFGDDILDVHTEESAVDAAESALRGSVTEPVKAWLRVVQARAVEDYAVLEPDSFIDAWTAATQVQGSDWDLRLRSCLRVWKDLDLRWMLVLLGTQSIPILSRSGDSVSEHRLLMQVTMFCETP
jgi:hypothetical protein